MCQIIIQYKSSYLRIAPPPPRIYLCFHFPNTNALKSAILKKVLSRYILENVIFYIHPYHLTLSHVRHLAIFMRKKN